MYFQNGAIEILEGLPFLNRPYDNERKSEQAHVPHAPTLLENAVYIFHFCQMSKFKKGVTSKEKNGIKISCGYAYLYIMSFITTKFHEILLSGYGGVALTNCVELYLSFWPNF